MATGALDANGIWIYGEDDSETTFSALLNKLGDSTSDALVSPGRIIQTVTATSTTSSSTTSTSFVDSNLSCSITPKKSTSQLYVYAYFDAYSATSGTITTKADFQITDSGNTPLQGAEDYWIGYYDNQGAVVRETYATVAMLGVVSAGSTSARTYKVRLKAETGTAYIFSSITTSRIVIQEVAA
jgi:hypothetical protein